MRLFALTLAFIGFLATPVLANHTAEHTANLDTIAVEVKGMVCDFCARSLEKVFYEREGVEGVDVNLDTQTVTLDTKKGTVLTDEDITKLIEFSGYTVVKITRETEQE